MVYANLVLRHGADAFATRLRDGGIDGLIVPDLPSEEADGVLAACDAAGVALIPLAAPTTTDDRLRHIGAQARGFLYTVSLTGITGERKDLSAGLPALLERAKAATEVPVARRLRHRDARAGPRGGGDGRRRRHRRLAPRPGGHGGRRSARRGGRTGQGPGRGAGGLDSRLRMGLVVATAAGLVVWIILWAIGLKAFDAFLITLVIVLLTQVVRGLMPHMPGRRQG